MCYFTSHLSASRMKALKLKYLNKTNNFVIPTDKALLKSGQLSVQVITASSVASLLTKTRYTFDRTSITYVHLTSLNTQQLYLNFIRFMFRARIES